MHPLTPPAKVALLIALGLADLMPDIAHAAEARGHAAAMRGDDAAADYWIGIAEAADDSMTLALTAREAVPVAIAPGLQRVFVT